MSSIDRLGIPNAELHDPRELPLRANTPSPALSSKENNTGEGEPGKENRSVPKKPKTNGQSSLLTPICILRNVLTYAPNSVTWKMSKTLTSMFSNVPLSVNCLGLSAEAQVPSVPKKAETLRSAC